MKKSYRIPIAILVCGLIYGCVFFGLPRQLNLSYNALEYQLGNTEFQKLTNISFDGWYYDRVFKKDCFVGTFTVGDKVFPNVKGTERELLMTYDKTKGTYYTLGEVIIGNYCKEITICLFEPKAGWNSGDGKMISAPATNRLEALGISNRLMQKRLINALE